MSTPADGDPAGGGGGRPGSRLARMGLFVGPLLFLALLLWPALPLTHPQRSAAAVTALTATWWITAALPVGATSLLPAALFPLLGVMGGGEVAPCYMKDLVFLFLGAFILSLGLERWNVHRRFALWTIARVGTQPRRLVLGFMCASAFLSFWINNTSTTLLMLPIGLAVIESVTGRRASHDDPFAIALLLGMAYSASVGGVATPVGTAPNQVFLGILRTEYPDAPVVSFGNWMLAFLPLVLVYLPLGWLLLTRVLLRVPRSGGSGAETIAAERRALGPLGRGERWMTAVFVTTAILWVTRAPLDFGPVRWPGWAGLLAPAGVARPAKFITDATVGTAMAILCFLIPVDRARGVRLMDWRTASRLPWEVLLLLGGGFAIAEGFKRTGLDAVLGEALAPLFTGVPPWVLVLTTVALVAALTEVTSNTATTAVLLPILGATAVEARLSPLLVMVPAVAAASCAFMLPVATPPNAVVFASRLVPAPAMARVGLGMNVLLGLLVTLLFQLWMRTVLGIEVELPSWAAPR